MTATPDLLADLVEDQTYQVHTSPDGQGGTRWFLMRYQVPPPEACFGEARLTWFQVATCTTATPNGRFRDVAFGWLRSLGHDPAAMDLVLFLDDGYERLRPGAA